MPLQPQERTLENYAAVYAAIPDTAWSQLREFIAEVDRHDAQGISATGTYDDPRCNLLFDLFYPGLGLGLQSGHFIIDFDWMHWREGEAMVREPRPLESADRKTCLMFLNAIVRAEKFTTNIMHSAFRSGAIQLAARRLYELHLSKEN